MIKSVFLLIGFSASVSWGQGFVCGFGLEPEPAGGKAVVGASSTYTPAFYQSGKGKNPLILFTKFSGAANPFDLTSLTALPGRTANTSHPVSDLFDPEVEGSFSHFFSKMSYMDLTFNKPSSSVGTTWYQSAGASPGLAGNVTGRFWGPLLIRNLEEK